MARTTKATTRVKAKTTAAGTKSAAAKTTRSTKAVKASAKPVVKEKTAVKKTAVTVKGKSKSTELTTKTLRKLNVVKALVFAGLAVAAGFLMNSSTYALSVGHAAKDQLISLTGGQTVFVPARTVLMDVELRWVVVTIMTIAALMSLLAATRLRRRYEASVLAGVSAMRWVGWGITTALMVATIALISGISDLWVLKAIAGLMLVTCALAWIVEKRLVQAGRPVWSEFIVSLFTGILPWLIIFGYAISTWVWGLVRYPWYVYALYASTIIGFTLLTVNQYKRISGWKNTLAVDRNYLLIGLATKSAFAIILILGFQK